MTYHRRSPCLDRSVRCGKYDKDGQFAKELRSSPKSSAATIANSFRSSLSSRNNPLQHQNCVANITFHALIDSCNENTMRIDRFVYI
ncbi:hypothetical protein GJ496_001083 [Pomphorhynchus laevis]|nr:hypothetical protein GJ496_001083 [Pomphorhynchus laevis]